MNVIDSTLHRLLLGLAAVIIGIPGVRLVFGTAGYVDGKDNLTLTPDLYSELRAMGAIFLASAVALLVGAGVNRLRGAATLVGTIAFLPQGILRLISHSIDEGQHESYLRAGVIETIIGVLFLLLLIRRLGSGTDIATKAYGP